MSRNPIDPNAKIALNNLKYEIARELGINGSPTVENTGLSPGADIFMAGHVGGQMTKRLVAMAERQLIENQNK